MKVAFSNIAWPADQREAVAQAMERDGITGVEIAPTMLWPRPAEVSAAEAGEVRRWWADRGIEVIAMQALLYGRPDLTVFGAAAGRRQTLDYLGQLFRLAAWLGARRLVFGSPRNRQAGTLEARERDAIAMAFFAEAGNAAAEFDVMLCIEPNPPGYDCDYITTVAEARALVATVASPGFGLHLDSGAMTLQGESPAVLAAGAPDHFHISEPWLSPVGAGDTDHAGFAGALRRAGYEGWCSVEMRQPEGDFDIGRLAGVMRFAAGTYGPPVEPVE